MGHKKRNDSATNKTAKETAFKHMSDGENTSLGPTCFRKTAAIITKAGVELLRPGLAQEGIGYQKKRKKGVKNHTDCRETSTQSEKSDTEKNLISGWTVSFSHRPAAPPLSPTSHMQSQGSGSGETGRLAQVGVSNLWVHMGSAWGKDREVKGSCVHFPEVPRPRFNRPWISRVSPNLGQHFWFEMAAGCLNGDSLTEHMLLSNIKFNDAGIWLIISL